MVGRAPRLSIMAKPPAAPGTIAALRTVPQNLESAATGSDEPVGVEKETEQDAEPYPDAYFQLLRHGCCE